jgi:methionine-R-sulfoxide reductase
MLTWPDVLNLAKNGNPAPLHRILKTDEEWRAQLSPEEYAVTRRAGTERPFSSEMCSLFEPGLYSCICCGTLLFDATQKFESGTGWPSFSQPLDQTAIAYRFDGPAFLHRVETICNTCDAHLGHVFPDGPGPSGLRYCMNAVALRKVTNGVDQIDIDEIAEVNFTGEDASQAEVRFKDGSVESFNGKEHPEVFALLNHWIAPTA